MLEWECTKIFTSHVAVCLWIFLWMWKKNLPSSSLLAEQALQPASQSRKSCVWVAYQPPAASLQEQVLLSYCFQYQTTGRRHEFFSVYILLHLSHTCPLTFFFSSFRYLTSSWWWERTSFTALESPTKTGSWGSARTATVTQGEDAHTPLLPRLWPASVLLIIVQSTKY